MNTSGEPVNKVDTSENTKSRAIDTGTTCHYCPENEYPTLYNNSWREQNHIKGNIHKN
jgi:hypothetical protein